MSPAIWMFFLKVPAASLDELKVLAERFPEIFDVGRCEERFLPFLGEIVGHRFDPTVNAAAQRRLIRGGRGDLQAQRAPSRHRPIAR